MLRPELFTEYFSSPSGGGPAVCPLLTVPGRLFPVKEVFLKEVMSVSGFDPQRFTGSDLRTSNSFRPLTHRRRKGGDSTDSLAPGEDVPAALYVALLAHIHAHAPRTAAVLVFMPGWSHIKGLLELLEAPGNEGLPCQELAVMPLHSQVSSQLQQRVFSPPP